MKKIIIAVMMLAVSCISQAAWQLDNNQSKLTFVTTKKTNISEVQTFKQLSASIANNGEVNLTINLASVDTNIAKRDERMKKYLFDVEQFAKATFSSKIDISQVKQLTVGTALPMQLSGTISLHGKQQEVTTEVLVTKLANNGLQVVSVAPIILYAKQFGLIAGIAKLQQLASLPSIGQSVPVYFVLNFKNK